MKRRSVTGRVISNDDRHLSPTLSREIFITATDTDAGKTWVTGAVVRAWIDQGRRAAALKPVACGLDTLGHNDDIDDLLAAQPMAHMDQINCYRFGLPAAPSQAARAEDKVIDPAWLVQWCQKHAASVDDCLIEGVGGLMTPITASWLVADWIEAMPDCAVWLVVGCKLGAINQTLLTLAKLKQMKRMPARIFFNACCAEHNAWIVPTRQAVEAFLPQDCVLSNIHFGEEIDIIPDCGQ